MSDTLFLPYGRGRSFSSTGKFNQEEWIKVSIFGASNNQLLTLPAPLWDGTIDFWEVSEWRLCASVYDVIVSHSKSSGERLKAREEYRGYFPNEWWVWYILSTKTHKHTQVATIPLTNTQPLCINNIWEVWIVWMHIMHIIWLYVGL